MPYAARIYRKLAGFERDCLACAVRKLLRQLYRASGADHNLLTLGVYFSPRPALGKGVLRDEPAVCTVLAMTRAVFLVPFHASKRRLGHRCCADPEMQECIAKSGRAQKALVMIGAQQSRRR